MSVNLLTEHHLEFRCLKGICKGSSESTLVKYHIVGNHMSWLTYLRKLKLGQYHSTVDHLKDNQRLHSLVLEHDASFVDHLCYVCLVFVVLSCASVY